jgi:rubrerythrin
VQLGTFGAIFSFALELEQQAVTFYEGAASGRLEEVFAERAKAGHKRVKRLERTRHEGVSEMILESITGLDGDDYRVDLAPVSDEADLLKQAVELEKATRRFYLDASKKMPVREVARVFERMARENDRHQADLEEL